MCHILLVCGSEFVGHTWRSACYPHSPRSSWIPKTFMCTDEMCIRDRLGRLFRTYCNTNQSRWPDYLEFFEASQRELQWPTGFTPNELQTGEMPKRVWDGYSRRIATQNLLIPNLVKKIEARTRIKRCAEERTEKFNADHKLVTFKTGEKVLLRALNVGNREDNTAAKFFRLYNGPYILSEQVGKNTYIVTNPNTNRVIGKFHASSLRNLLR